MGVGDHIVINIDSEPDDSTDDEPTDNSSGNHNYANLISDEESDQEIPQVASSDERSTTESGVENSNNVQEQEPFMGYEVEVELEDEKNEEAPQVLDPTCLKRPNSDSEVTPPVNKRPRSSTPNDRAMGNELSPTCAESIRNQLRDLRHFCEHLQNLLERTSQQVSQLQETVSRIQPFWNLSAQNALCRNCNAELHPERQEIFVQANIAETVARPLMVWVEMEDSIPSLGVIPTFYNAYIQNINNDILPGEPAVEESLLPMQSADLIQVNNPDEQPIYPVIKGMEGMNKDTTDTSYSCIPSDMEIPGILETNPENNNVILIDPAFEGKDREQDAAHAAVFPNTDKSTALEASLENNREMMNLPPVVENNSDQQNLSSAKPKPDSDTQEVVLVELPEKAEVMVNGQKQKVYFPALIGSIVPPDPETLAASVASEIVIEKLLLVEMPINPENIVDDNPKIVTNPVVPENDGGSESSLVVTSVSSDIEMSNSEESNSQISNNPYLTGNDVARFISAFSTRPGFGSRWKTHDRENYPASTENDNEQAYLGNPRRNIKILNSHLMTAQAKSTPNHAAFYLVNVIFSEETLLFSSVDHKTPGCVPLDQNKMEGIREYLTTIFPDCDLTENGKDWKDCLSAITFLIDYLYNETEIPANRNPSMRVSANWHSRNHNVEDENCSSWLLQVRNAVVRENTAVSENTGSIDNAAIFSEELVYLGDPARNVQILYSILSIAKAQFRPDLSARYLILYLFPEEVLIGSNVYGNLACDLFALDHNRIEALREFLQGSFPEYDLEQAGYYWKLCVTVINSCLQTLRRGPQILM